MGGSCGTCGGEKSCIQRFIRKSEGKRPIGRPRRRWKDNIEMNLIEIGYEFVDWSGLAYHRGMWRAVGNTVVNLWVP